MMIDLCHLEAYEHSVRDTTKQLDFWRLLFIRSRRMLLLSAKFLEQFEVYTAWVTFLDDFLRILALYQACVLIPRFVLNVLYVAGHLQGPISHDMIARCWEMAYDFGWIMNGVLAAFILVGPLASLVIYLPVLTPSYQLCVRATRFLMDYSYGKTFEEDYADLMRLVIQMAVNICIISTSMVMLVGGGNPVVPFLAAVAAVAVTLVSKMLAKNMVSDTAPYSKQSLFASGQPPGKMEQKEEECPLVLHEKSW